MKRWLKNAFVLGSLLVLSTQALATDVDTETANVELKVLNPLAITTVWKLSLGRVLMGETSDTRFDNNKWDDKYSAKINVNVTPIYDNASGTEHILFGCDETVTLESAEGKTLDVALYWNVLDKKWTDPHDNVLPYEKDGLRGEGGVDDKKVHTILDNRNFVVHGAMLEPAAAPGYYENTFKVYTRYNNPIY